VCALLALCGVLGFLQYRSITEVGITAGERLRESLQRSLTRLGQDFDSEIASTCAALTPGNLSAGPQALQTDVAERYAQWRKGARRGRIFEHLAIGIREGDAIELRSLVLERGVFETVAWPAGWESMKARLESNFAPGRGDRGPDHGPGPPPDRDSPRGPPPRPGGRGRSDGMLFEEPLFSSYSGGPRPGAFDHTEAAWLIFEWSPAYFREVMLPQIVQRDLGADYQVEVVTNTGSPSVIYQSDPGLSQDLAVNADASITFFDPPAYPGGRRAGGPPGMRDRGPGSGPGRGPEPELGRWRMFVRHRAGSLEAVAAQSRWRSLAVTGGVLLLILATAAALIRYTRRAQKLADLQMEFVAGVSHELRTPLTVIHTAAYNLQGKLAHNPAQVEKYGALIQRESGRLGELVEQVLQFASVSAGRIPQERKPVSVEAVIDETMEANKAVMDGCGCVVVKAVDPDLPPVLGDAKALRQVIENLLGNAAKYGKSQGSSWIGIFASKAAGNRPDAIEIRVTDRGPGIGADEQAHIFDPFFRGARAIEDQIHGTGLGLSLVKNIVEAHGGSVRVKSEPMKGAEFIVLLPAAPAGVAG